mmetsp:Transcript_9794/g.22566  ORF Transcript_9794/g.22566 Transcript_9794/m.22566 type:complete len:157 (-) Transcript_9794:467-937(-)
MPHWLHSRSGDHPWDMGIQSSASMNPPMRMQLVDAKNTTKQQDEFTKRKPSKGNSRSMKPPRRQDSQEAKMMLQANGTYQRQTRSGKEKQADRQENKVPPGCRRFDDSAKQNVPDNKSDVASTMGPRGCRLFLEFKKKPPKKTTPREDDPAHRVAN